MKNHILRAFVCSGSGFSELKALERSVKILNEIGGRSYIEFSNIDL